MISFEKVSPKLNDVVIRNILNATGNFKLELYSGGLNQNPNLWSGYRPDSSPKRICKIIPYNILDFDLFNKSLEEAETLIKAYNPDDFILVIQKPLTPVNKDRIISYFHHVRFSKFQLFDLVDLDRIVNENPGLKHLFKDFQDDASLKTTTNRIEKIRSYFLGGSNWEEAGDQEQRFYKEGIWENGYDDKYTELVKSAQPNDVIFLKSTYATATTGYLRIKGIGVVRGNSNEGKKLIVDWKVRDIKIDIAGLSKYRNTFSILDEKDCLTIVNSLAKLFGLEKLSISDLEELLAKKSPYELTKKSKEAEVVNLRDKLGNLNSKNFWWINNTTGDLYTEEKRVGKTIEYSTLNPSSNPRQVNEYFYQLKIGDIAIGYEVSPTSRIISLLEIIEPAVNKAGDTILFKIIYFFDVQLGWNQLYFQDFFKNSEVGKSKEGSIFKLSLDQFLSILNLTELSSYKINFTNDLSYENGNERKSDEFSDIIENISRIANINSDSDIGEDLLDIKKDINAFAKITASKSFVPPVAIALFGQWGSGKSFFMNKLKDRVKELTNGNNESYCKGVVQIHFNAWSYLDANLWASIVTKIFEELHNYIANDNEANKVKSKIQQELSEKLNLTKEELKSLQQKNSDASKNIDRLQIQKQKLRDSLNSKINEIKTKTLVSIISKVNSTFNVTKKLENAIADNTKLSYDLEEIKKIVPEQYWQNPEATLTELQSKKTFLKEFFRSEKLAINVICISLILLLISFVPFLVEMGSDYIAKTSFILPQILLSLLTIIVPTYKRFVATYSKIQPLISIFWNIKTDYEKELANAIFVNKQREEAIRLEIENTEKELELVNKQIVQANELKNNIEFKLNNALSTEALYTFITSKNNSDEYKKHLGIVSLIRKDFEILSQLFDEHNSETKKFRDQFEYPIERIVLYIDDLDRCSEERVVEVLEAVNLLMAFPLFVVVVGVDHRWVKNALIKKYHLQFTGKHNDLAIDEITKIDPSNYLEKIFQIPFHLKTASSLSVKNMIENLSRPKKVQKENENSNETQKNNVKRFSNSFETQEGTEPSLILGGTTKTTNIDPQIGDLDVIIPAKSIDEYVELSELEIESMKELTELIGNNPRAIKRFVNIYKILKAHEDLSINDAQKDKDALLVMFLLALSIGPYKTITAMIYNFINSNNNFKTISAFFSEYLLEVEVIEKNGNDEYTEEFKKMTSLNAALNNMNSKNMLLECNATQSKKHLDFIKRFTFEIN